MIYNYCNLYNWTSRHVQNIHVYDSSGCNYWLPVTVTDRTSGFYDTYSDYISTTELLVYSVLKSVNLDVCVLNTQWSPALFELHCWFVSVYRRVCFHARVMTHYMVLLWLEISGNRRRCCLRIRLQTGDPQDPWARFHLIFFTNFYAQDFAFVLIRIK